LHTHESIANKEARELCAIPSENAMKHQLQRMVEAGLLEVVKGDTVFQTRYKKSGDA
jgi:hypothetical protein